MLFLDGCINFCPTSFLHGVIWARKSDVFATTTKTFFTPQAFPPQAIDLGSQSFLPSLLHKLDQDLQNVWSQYALSLLVWYISALQNRTLCYQYLSISISISLSVMVVYMSQYDNLYNRGLAGVRKCGHNF